MGDLNAPEIKQQEAKEFHPAVQNRLSPVVEGLEVSLVQDTNDAGEVIKETANALPFQLGGVYGVRARDRADTILIGDYEVPIYAQWKFGAGMVGSFMCDLSGVWSEELFKDTNGQKLVKNIVANLMPTENIRPRSIRFDLEEENYINRLSIYATLEEGERIEAGIIEYDDSGENVISFNKLTGDADEADVYVTGDLNADNHYTRSTFVVKKSGTYKIFINKIAADGTVAASVETYKTFSYSKEYERDPEITEFDPSAYMQELSRKGNGNSVSAEDPWSIFNDFVTGNHRVYDPALVFMIIAAVCFLLDVAVRKFKFKWPHEIIRNIKERRAAEKE